MSMKMSALMLVPCIMNVHALFTTAVGGEGPPVDVSQNSANECNVYKYDACCDDGKHIYLGDSDKICFLLKDHLTPDGGHSYGQYAKAIIEELKYQSYNDFVNLGQPDILTLGRSLNLTMGAQVHLSRQLPTFANGVQLTFPKESEVQTECNVYKYDACCDDGKHIYLGDSDKICFLLKDHLTPIGAGDSFAAYAHSIITEHQLESYDDFVSLPKLKRIELADDLSMKVGMTEGHRHLFMAYQQRS